MALQLAYAYRGQRETWHGDLRLVRSNERNSESGGYTWTVFQRTVQERPDDGQYLQDLQPGAEHPEHPEDADAATPPGTRRTGP